MDDDSAFVSALSGNLSQGLENKWLSWQKETFLTSMLNGYSTSHCHYREKLSKRFATNVLISQMGFVIVNKGRFLFTAVLCW